MPLKEAVITGSESIKAKSSDPEFALVDFYHALNSEDLDLVSKIGSKQNNQVCLIHSVD